MIWSYDFKLSEYSALMFCLTAQFWLLLCVFYLLYIWVSHLSPTDSHFHWIHLEFFFPNFLSLCPVKPPLLHLFLSPSHLNWDKLKATNIGEEFRMFQVIPHTFIMRRDLKHCELFTNIYEVSSHPSGVQQEGWLGILWTVHKCLLSFKSHLTCSAWGVTWNGELFTIVCNVSSQLSCVKRREWLAKVVNCSPIFAKFQVTPYAEGMRGWLETLPMFGPITGLRSHAVVSVWIWSWALLYFRGIHPAKLYKWKYDLKQRQKRTHSQIERNSWLTLWFLYD